MTEARTLQARDLWHVMAKANQRICSSFRRSGEARLDPKGRVDVCDMRGVTIARIYCAETLAAAS